VIILIYYLYFSELKWIRYEFAKFQQFSRIFKIGLILFVPNRYLTNATDWWARATSAAPVALTESTWLTKHRSSSPVRQTTMAAMIGDFPGRASKLKRFGRTQGAFWWRRLHKKATGVTPVSLYCGGGRRSMAFASYGGPRNAIKWPGDA
jgi:hypothetical protein